MHAVKSRYDECGCKNKTQNISGSHSFQIHQSSGCEHVAGFPREEKNIEYNDNTKMEVLFHKSILSLF